MSEIVLNKYGCNAAIKVHILPDNQMRSAGFTDCREGYWFFERTCIDEISFSLTIKKDDSSDWRIDVLDEDFLQPYDYQHMLEYNPTFSYALKVQRKVEQFMKQLTDAGIISGHNYGDYI